MFDKVKANENSKLFRFLGKYIRWGSLIVLCVTIVIVIIAVFDGNTTGEADMGSFETADFSSGWTLYRDGEAEELDLPAQADAKDGDKLVLSKTLPENVTDGMSLMIRSSMQDIRVFIDGALRDEYSSDTLPFDMYNLPSAYIVTQLTHDDAGKTVEYHITIKNNPTLNSVSLGYGNNGWYGQIRSNIVVTIIAIITMVMGLLLIFGILITYRRSLTDVAALLFLGTLVVDISLWILSESRIRQLFLQRASLSGYFAYFTVEMIAVFASLYFDAVQHRTYHKRFLVAQTIVFTQFILNLILHFTGVCDLYSTLVFSHIMSAPVAIVFVIGTITDIRTGRIKKYIYNACGMGFFLIFTLCELAAFWVNRSQPLGIYICIGLILMMFCAVVQVIADNKRAREEHEQRRTAMTVSTIETIAGAIDARDEYTGGHSERVGLYAERLAQEIADDYGLTPEDVFRIHYIGLVHDIGKIGVADNVLNKAGKLTPEEFSLMKKHTEIGYEVMQSLDEEVEGLLDGIRYHHERYDGTGYPDGLSGEDIPLLARILAIADSYDAMTSNRVYRKRLSDERVRNELLACSGTQFDPNLAKIFVGLIDSGDIKPSTIMGVSSDDGGRVRGSALLEKKLQADLLNGVKISFPSHVRMLCYLMKLMEKKGKAYRVLFVRTGTGNKNTFPGQLLSDHDVNIQYQAGVNVIAFYDRDETEFLTITKALKAGGWEFEVFEE